jgi:hypothetical protein
MLLDVSVVVGIVKSAVGDDFSSLPGECDVALSAPHLVTPRYLVNGRGAFGAGTSGFLHHFHSSHVVRVALVLIIHGLITDDFEALAACKLFTQSALVVRAKKSTAVSVGTTTRENQLGFGSHNSSVNRVGNLSPQKVNLGYMIFVMSP